MINKRLLIKNLLSHNDENSFYDKKRQLNLDSREGKAKFLKHICALTNSNPTNNSYIVVGVEDHNNEIVGDDFFDDSRIQNLVNAYLENPPQIQYENIPFPNLPKDKVIGLVTVKPNRLISFFKKGIHTIPKKSIFKRIGSNSMPIENLSEKKNHNSSLVFNIENNSRNGIENTLDGVIDFINHRHKDLPAQYKVFKETFVICWAGLPKKMHNEIFLSRVDIELINEQIKLFYSIQDAVTITYNDHMFTITEYVPLGLSGSATYYPLEKKTIHFYDNGNYKIQTAMLFQPPQFNRKMLEYVYDHNILLIEKLLKGLHLKEKEIKELENLPSTFMICYLNGFPDALQKLIDTKLLLKTFPKAYSSFKEAVRILRKMKYDQD
jgi:hypothetical protein